MKKIDLIILIFTGASLFSQNLRLETLLNDSISIRAIACDAGKIWYTGTNSKFGYVNLNDPYDAKQIRLSKEKLQLRTLAKNRNFFYTINIESPANFFKIDESNLHSEIIYTDSLPTAFYDAFLFVKKDLGYAFSDPDEKQNLRLAVIKNKRNKSKVTFHETLKLSDGEAAFAASNSNIAAQGKYIWIATGGNVSRIIRIDLKDHKTEVFATSIIQGTKSQGIYSVDFANEKWGIAAGGDFTKQEANIDNIIVTTDGGATWHVEASGRNSGYITCVKIRPGSGGKEIVAVGDQHISYSSDFGKTWAKISNEKNIYVCQWIDDSTLIFAGKNRILKGKLRFGEKTF